MLTPSGVAIDDRPFLRTAEFDFRAAVDPYADAAAIATLEDEAGQGFGADVEEGYVVIKRLPILESAPLGLKLKLGRRAGHRPADQAAGVVRLRPGPAVVAPLPRRVGNGVETEDQVRERTVQALRAIGDPRAVHALVDAAARDTEPDLAVAMAVAAFELAGSGQEADLRRAGDALVRVMSDDGAPNAARRDAGDALRAHVTLDPCCRDDAAKAAAWWREHRDAVTWQAAARQFTAASGG